jgi:hypothetical protein
MSSLHIYIHTQPSCHAQEHSRHHGAEKNLREGIAAVIVLALLERLMQAAKQGGSCHGHAGHSGANGPDAGHAGPTGQAGAAGNAGAVQPGAANGDAQTGVLPQFMALLILLALLSGQQGRHGHANHLSDRLADKLADKLADRIADKLMGDPGFGSGTTQAPGTDAPGNTAPETDTNTGTDTEVPDSTASTPDIDTPDIDTPDIDLPDIDTPDTPPPTSDGSPTTDDRSGFEDAVDMMVNAMRAGHADSLMAGQDDAAFEQKLQQMASDLRQELTSR